MDASQLFLGLRRSEAEVLVLESEQDELIPHSVIETYLRNCSGPTTRSWPKRLTA